VAAIVQEHRVIVLRGQASLVCLDLKGWVGLKA